MKGRQPTDVVVGMGLIRVLVGVAVALISGCASITIEERYGQLDAVDPLSRAYYHVGIPSHDGIVLTATVYQPALAAGETAPLILHTHGFGAFRASRPVSIYGQLVLSGQAAMAAWRSGYWVISYDQRGFGDSEGLVYLMDPDYEVQDFISVLDWADNRLPRLHRDATGDPYVGASGESYGGVVQILASMMDPRLDAIVPTATWHDLENALAPNGVIQSFWPDLLKLVGKISSGFDFDMIDEDQYQAALSGLIDEPARVDLSRRSPSTYCSKGQTIQADALFIQGLRDVLFPLNHGLANWRCARDAGSDAYLVVIQDGHILPWPMQKWSGMPLFNTQSRIRCGEQDTDAIGMMLAFWDEKLKGQVAPGRRAPLCLTFASGRGLALERIPDNGLEVAIPETSVKLAFSGIMELFLYPWDLFWGLLTPTQQVVPDVLQGTTGGTLRPAFVPLYVARSGDALIGIPRLALDVQVQAEEEAGTLFAALGVRRPGSPAVDIIHEQFTPMIVPAVHDTDMPGVVRPLHQGDTVGLVLQGFTGAYYERAHGWRHRAWVSGSVTLPLEQEGVSRAASPAYLSSREIRDRLKQR